MSNFRILLAFGMMFVAAGSYGRPSTSELWIEGENATRSQTYRNAWFDDVDADELSGGKQIASFSEANKPGGWAEYDFELDHAGTYAFWLRANPGSGLLYKLDGGNWQKMDPDALQHAGAAVQRFNVAGDGTFDARDMLWFHPGDLPLSAGRHTIRFNLGGDDASKARFAAIDCFVMADGPFAPNFQYKPGEAPSGIESVDLAKTWSFTPPRDTLTPDALLDLRFLNEKTAGEHGFVRRSKDGDGFVRGDGAPIRFWGGCDYVQRIARDQKNQAVLEHHAQFLAKRGVNIVRLHGAIEPKGDDSNLEDIDANELDEMFRLVAAMKKAGVYTMIDPYWAVAAHARPKWGLPDSGAGNLTGMLFFDKTLQRGYRAWLKRIYSDVNPYTGIPLAKDPSIAAIQLQNEDSLLFWTEQLIKGPALIELRQQFGQFLTHKYGDLDRVQRRWADTKADDDDFAHGLPGILPIWNLTQDARNKIPSSPGREARLADETEFFGRTMSAFNAETANYLKHDLGCRQLVLPGNWRTADQVILDDAERWSYMAGEVEGKNHYFTGVHNGLNVGWQIIPGQVYTSRSWIKDPIGSPLGIRQVVGRPFMVPESLWVPPNRYDCEGPMIVSAQSSLTGLGPFFWFADGVEEWDAPISKWTYAIPPTLGQFPAAALSYRLGYVEPSAPVVHEELADADVFGRKMPLIAEEGAWDPNRDSVQMPAGSPYRSEVDPLAFLVGRVEVKFGGDPAKSRVVDLKPYIDPSRTLVKSLTGQIVTDRTRGVYQVRAPKIQSAVGFLGTAGPQNLPDVTIDCKNSFASVAVASLDQSPLADSKKVLVQFGAESRPEGWQDRRASAHADLAKLGGRRIVDTGHGPWRIAKADLVVRLRNRSAHRVRALDPNGMPNAEIALRREGEWIEFRFPDSALYVVVE